VIHLRKINAAETVPTPGDGRGVVWLRDDNRLVVTDELGVDHPISAVDAPGVQGVQGVQGVKGDRGESGLLLRSVNVQQVSLPASGENELLRIAIPANLLAVNDVINFDSWGRLTCTATVMNVSVRVRLGQSPILANNPVILSHVYINGAVRDRHRVSLSGAVAIRAVGAAASAFAVIREVRPTQNTSETATNDVAASFDSTQVNYLTVSSFLSASGNTMVWEFSEARAHR
jgi:hypothetical protein